MFDTDRDKRSNYTYTLYIARLSHHSTIDTSPISEILSNTVIQGHNYKPIKSNFRPTQNSKPQKNSPLG